LLEVRPATPADVPVLVALWTELRQVGGRAERAVNPVPVPDIAERLAEAVTAPHCRVVLVCADGRPAGMAVLRDIRPDPLSPARVVQIAHLVVAPGLRRRGVGHALIAAAADFADERGIEHVGGGLYPSLRDASRFYARLGFAPVTVQRVAPVAILRRRLASEPVAQRMEDVVRRRTRLRRTVPAQRRRARAAQPVD
jgi:GNAT superfamily N-acetyltransferase